MTKRILISMMATFFLATFTVTALAEEGLGGNKRKGKYTYRKVYKACMERGEVSSPKPIINPADKTMEQWKRIYETKDFSEFKCSDEWNSLSEEAVLDIFSYLHSGAADSPTPATCK